MQALQNMKSLVEGGMLPPARSGDGRATGAPTQQG